MESGFGARLRAHREQQQVALADIAEHTKIKVSLLAALERDDVSQWPSGIFRRSYIRAYARAIGLEPDAIVREFLERFPDPEDESAASLTALEGATTKGRPPTRLRFLIASAMDALPVRRSSPAPKKAAAVTAGQGAFAGVEDEGPFLAAPLRPAIAAAHEWIGDTPPAAPTEVLEEQPQPTLETPALATEAAAPAAARDQLAELAALCTRLARIADASELGPAFENAVSLLGAQGVILWMWDAQGSALRPVLGHGYPHDMLTRLGGVSPDADNAIAAAFRTSDTQEVNGSLEETGAVVAPLITSAGCAGVLAFELPGGRQSGGVVKSFAAIIAAQLAALIA